MNLAVATRVALPMLTNIEARRGHHTFCQI